MQNASNIMKLTGVSRMEFVIDFEYDENVVKMYHASLGTVFTNEGRKFGREYTLEQTRNRLYEASKSKNKKWF